MACVTFIALVLAVSGCRSEERPKPPPLPIDGIELVNDGVEPRRPLRYKLTAPSEAAIEFAIDLDAKTTEYDAQIPTLTMAVDVAVTQVLPDGSAAMKMTVGTAGGTSRAEGDALAVELMNRQSKLLTGMIVTYRLTPTGEVKDTKLDASGRDLSEPMKDQTTTLLQASEQLAMGLPEQPVGVGAIWKHRRTMKHSQLTLVSMTTVEVTAIDGDSVTFKSTTEMTGADQTLAQGSATMQVTGVRGTGSQTGTFDLAKAIVIGELQASLGFEMHADGAPRPTKLDVTTRIKPRAKP